MENLTWNDIHAISEVMWNVSPMFAIMAYALKLIIVGEE